MSLILTIVLTLLLAGGLFLFIWMPGVLFKTAGGALLSVGGVGLLMHGEVPFTYAMFFSLAGLSVFGGLMLIIHKNPIHSALSLILTLFMTCGLFVLLDATFMAILQLLVYTGAIMVVFVFVIMMLNLKEEEWGFRRLSWLKTIGVLLVVVILAQMIILIGGTGTSKDQKLVGLRVRTAPTQEQIESGKRFPGPTVDGAGVMVTRVQQNSLADRLGLQPNDVIIRAAYRGLSNVEDFGIGVRCYRVGSPAKMVVIRKVAAQGEAKATVERLTLKTEVLEGDLEVKFDGREEHYAYAAEWHPPVENGQQPDPRLVKGTIEDIGGLLMGRYQFLFQIAALLLLAAIVGGVVVARKEI